MRKLSTSIILLLGFGFSAAFSQIDFLGSLDISAGAGGKNSSFETNGLNNNYRNAHLNIHEFNLFMFTQVSDAFFFSGRLQWDTWGSGKLNPPKLTLAELSWEPPGEAYSASLGRFVSPFGLYPKRQISTQNNFIQAPLAYGYFLNISDEKGYWPGVGSAVSGYGAGDVGVTTLYFGGYLTGGQFNYIIVPETMDISIAVANAAPASPRNFSNLAEYAVVTRIGLQPVIYWQQGLSFSYGNFMYDAGYDSSYKDMDKFTQLLLGTDFIISGGYFELTGEFIYSSWSVPAWQDRSLISRMQSYLVAYPLTNYTGYVDLKVEPPFIPGSYLALRYDMMTFDTFKNPKPDVLLTLPRKWDNDVSAYSAAFGYKLSEAVLLKLVYSDLIYAKSQFDGEYWTMRALLNVSM